jgi:hypothetical protein
VTLAIAAARFVVAVIFHAVDLWKETKHAANASPLTQQIGNVATLPSGKQPPRARPPRESNSFQLHYRKPRTGFSCRSISAEIFACGAARARVYVFYRPEDEVYTLHIAKALRTTRLDGEERNKVTRTTATHARP